MKLLALLSDVPGARGGIAQYNRDLLTALAACKSGASILVVARAGAAEPSSAMPHIRQVAPRGKIRFVLAALRVALLDGPFDAVFCGHINLALLAALIARLLGIRWWLQLHGIEAWGPLSRQQIWAAERASLITAVSRYTRRRFLGVVAVDPRRVRVLPNTFADDFRPGPKPDYLLNRLGLKGKKVLLTVGRLAADERGKGHDRVIAALPELLATCPNAVYVIVGEGDDRRRLEQLARLVGVWDHIVFAGPAEDAELPDYYRAADVFVMPSVQEGFGIVFLEAAASGLKAIAGNRDGSIDALAAGWSGRLVDPADRSQLVQALREAVSDPSPGAQPLERFRFANFAAQACALWAGLTAHDLVQTAPAGDSPAESIVDTPRSWA